MKKLLSILLAAVLLAGCSAEQPQSGTQGSNAATAPTASGTVPSQVDSQDLFSDRDYRTDYDPGKSVSIHLEGATAQSNSKAVQISGGTVTLGDEGVYVLSGSLTDGIIIVDAEKTDKLQLVLRGVSIHSQSGASIYVKQADKVFITLEEGTVSTLSNGGSFVALDDNNIDAVIFSKEDITFNGAGGLNITSPAGHGIVSKDSLTVTGGAYVLQTASHGLVGKDDIAIADASMHITAGKDGIHAENKDDAALGHVYIQAGSYTVDAQGDGISAAALLQIDGGGFEIVAGGGSENGTKTSSDHWGGFGGPGGGRPGGHGGFGGPGDAYETEEDSTSMKGLKAGAQLLITGGSFSVDSADDAVHSDDDLTVTGGSFAVATGDDGFHAEETLTVSDGADINIAESYEGLEALHIRVTGGEITLAASDDGLNAAGGTDQSGFGGRDNGMFGGGRPGGMGGGGNGSIVISGGKLNIQAFGDGIDANGTLEITGGCTVVCGPTRGDTATLDYDTSAVIRGGTFLGTGASGMAQTFSASEQGVISVQVGGASVGTQITVTDETGNVVITHSPALEFSVLILSSPDLVKGQTYTVQVGEASGTFTAE